MRPVGDGGVKLQYKLAQTRPRPVNIARMRDDPTSVIGRYDSLYCMSADSCFCWQPATTFYHIMMNKDVYS